MEKSPQFNAQISMFSEGLLLLIQAEKLLKKLYATKNLRDATVARKLAALEKAIDTVKKGGWEKDLQREMQEANALLEKVSIRFVIIS